MIINILAVIGVIALIICGMVVVMALASYRHDTNTHEQSVSEARDYYGQEAERWRN